MPIVAEIRKTVTDATPVLAAVGATDLAVEKVRHARARASAKRAQLGAELTAARLQSLAAERAVAALRQAETQAQVVRAHAEAAAEQAQQVPALALNRGLVIAGRAQESYAALATRGETLLRRVRTQQATKDLVAQAGSTVALGKGAVTTVRRSAGEIERSVKATLTTGRTEATAAAGAVTGSVAQEAGAATGAVKESAARTRTAAKRTATTTKKRAAASKTATKRATTSVQKTAEAAAKATEAAADKIGD